jgi:serine/threonine-protein kinase HipA
MHRMTDWGSTWRVKNFQSESLRQGNENMERVIEVFVELDGTSQFVGRLWSRSPKGRESASFEYDKKWIASDARFALEPLLTIDTGIHHSQPGKPLFGAIGDSAPDRWGRALMRRAERKNAEREKRTQRTLLEVDYLLQVDDQIRQGALRFREAGTTEFLAHGYPAIPPLVELPRLLSASDHVLTDTDTDEDLRLLLAPGSSLGGARPKAAVLDADGSLAIAKFPAKGDEYHIESWSCVALALASQSGISTPRYRLASVRDQQLLLITRFDREGSVRIPFLSAMSMIGADENQPHSYLELVDAIRQHGAEVRKDLKELWRRILFSVLVSNVDDHLRNHGFLYDTDKRGWRLSPAYDLNPVPIDMKPRLLCLMIDDQDNSASFELTVEVGDYFGLAEDDMRAVVTDVVNSISTWRNEARRTGVSAEEIDRMSTAFEHDEMQRAQRFLRSGS